MEKINSIFLEDDTNEFDSFDEIETMKIEGNLTFIPDEFILHFESLEKVEINTQIIQSM